MSFIAYFLSISISILLVYNFLTTVLFCFQKELLTENKRIRIFQQFLLGIILILMFAYSFNTKSISAELYVIPWIWGFLASHLFIIRKKRWIHELLGLGILLAIAIIIYFKNSEIIKFCMNQNLQQVGFEVYLIYVSLGVVLGYILWPQLSNHMLTPREMHKQNKLKRKQYKSKKA